MLLSYTLHKSPHRWLCSLLADNMQSLECLCDLIKENFHHFYLDHLDQKMLQKLKAMHESTMDFWQHFHDLQFRAPKSQMKIFYLWDQFEYYVRKSSHPKEKFGFKPHSTCFTNGAVQSQMDVVTITSDCLPSPHQTAPPSQSDV